MQNVMRTPNPNIARRDDSEGPHERNRWTPRRARIGRSPMEDENSLQTEDRQNDLDQDGRPTITQVKRVMKLSETGDNEKSFGEPGYYESKIGS